MESPPSRCSTSKRGRNDRPRKPTLHERGLPETQRLAKRQGRIVVRSSEGEAVDGGGLAVEDERAM